jgi:hypothetical protein
MKDLHISIKCSMIAFGVALLMLVLFILSVSARAQQPGIHYGWINGTGHVAGLQVNEFKNQWGFYTNHYSYSYQPYDQSGKDYRNTADSYTTADGIADKMYKGITLGISHRVTRSGSRHPVFAYAGIGNIDITERHKVYTDYFINGFEVNEITWYDKTYKFLSPEAGMSVAALDCSWMQFGVGSFFKYPVGVSGWGYISAKF